MVQGREHILFLSITGKIYGIGNNTKYQITGNNLNRVPTKSRIRQKSEIESQVQLKPNNDLLSSINFETQKKLITFNSLNKESEVEFYCKKPQEIHFNDTISTFYKILAINNTSLAINRSGQLYIWGDDCLGVVGSSESSKIKEPLLIDSILGFGLSLDSKQ